MSRFYLSTPSNVSNEDLSPGQSRRGDPHSDFDFDDDDDDLSSLPYPKPLPRSAFLAPDFNASEYLSTLRNRHQTLADLRAELRTRSQTLAKELVDLVNDEYQAFLGLGSDLHGGEEKVEAVRVGVLGFVKGVEGVRNSVVTRKQDVAELLGEKKKIAAQLQVGRRLVEVHTRTAELEDALAISSSVSHERAAGAKDEKLDEGDADSDDEDDEDEEDEDGQDMTGVASLERLVMNYLVLQQMMEHIGKDHPFLVKQQDRLAKIHSTLLLDLGTALKQAKAKGAQNKAKLLRLVALYGEIGEGKEAIKILKETKPR